MNSAEFLRWLRKNGCKVDATSGKGGHAKVSRGSRVSYVPTHGAKKELGTGLVDAIKKQLGLK
jgi:mRNA interferase HicA